MHTHATKSQSVIERIPKPESIRVRLAELVREVNLLRAQLTVSERAAKARDMARGTAEASDPN